MRRRYDDVDSLVSDLLARIGGRIALGLPLGIGKANHIANTLYRRVSADPALSLEIYTALTLSRPRASGELARRFIEPLSERLYADYPDLDYAIARERGALPRNVRVHEFFFKPGAFLHDTRAQRDYLCSNYTHAARDVHTRGVNVVAQLVARRRAPDGTETYSLGSNPDLTLDLMTRAREESPRRTLFVAQVNEEMPFMEHDAEVAAEAFDAVLDSPRYQFPLFAVPAPPLSPVAHAIGLRASALIADGGTLQVGIGALGDALCHALLLRHTRNADYTALRDALGATADDRDLVRRIGGIDPFERRLYGMSEMVTEALLELFQAGIVGREVHDDIEGRQGIALHGGFFLGSPRFYETLRDMPPEDRARICMTRISRVNQLYGDEALRRSQRTAARFANSALKTTLLGAVASDALPDGRIVSGVGGQHDFVSMAHALEGARSIIMLPSTRKVGGGIESNVLWNHANVTIPRHLRDIVVTEYGVADLRGRTDEEVVAAMLGIADSRFQDALLREARAQGKVAAGYVIPAQYRDNEPQRVQRALRARPDAAPAYPFGTVLTPEEAVLADVLESLREKSATWRGRAALAADALLRGKADAKDAACLERMALVTPRSMTERWLRRLIASQLATRRSARS